MEIYPCSKIYINNRKFCPPENLNVNIGFYMNKLNNRVSVVSYYKDTLLCKEELAALSYSDIHRFILVNMKKKTNIVA